MSDYQNGERVLITIDAIVGHEGAEGWLNYFVGGTPHRTMIAKPGVTVQRIAPEYTAGQVLRDTDGDLWLATERCIDGDRSVELVCAVTKGPSYGACNDAIVQRFGPLVPVAIES